MTLARIKVKNPVGINASVSPSDLPLEKWSSGINIRFKNGKVIKALGHEPIFPAPVPIYSMLPYLSQNTPFWFLGAAASIFRTEGKTAVNVSRLSGGPYNASKTNPWYGGSLSQVAVWNNGVDVPQIMYPNSSNFQDLPNWPALTRAKIVRPFKNYLIALNITKNSVNFPSLVKWSSPADPGEVPFTWDPADPKNDAGENPLADTQGAIIDGIKLRDSFIIYKEDSVYSMRYIGGLFVWQFQKLFDDVGMMAPNCAAEFDGKHFVIGQGDVYVHNGVQKSSVIDGQMREYLFTNMKADLIRRTFVIPDYNNTEMWICYCSTALPYGSDYCDRAVIYNWKEDTWTIRDLPKVFSGAVGIVDPKTSDAWNDDPATWEKDNTAWYEGSYDQLKTKILLSSINNSKIYLVGDTATFDGQPFNCMIERTGIYLGDDRMMKTVSALIPHMTGRAIAKIYIGHSTLQDGPYTWKGPFDFGLGVQYKLDCKSVGRYVGVRFEIESPGSWSMNGYTLEMAKPAGMR